MGTKEILMGDIKNLENEGIINNSPELLQSAAHLKAILLYLEGRMTFEEARSFSHGEVD